MKRADRRAQLRQTTTADKAIATTDSYTNAAARLGLGSGSIASQGTYTTQYLSHNRVLLDNIYTGSWIAAKAVDAFAEDMTKKGIEITGPVEPDRIEKLLHEFARLQIWESLCDGLRWSRLYGGSVCILLISGQDMSTPLRSETIGKGQMVGLLALDRWVVMPDLTEVITELCPNLGKPKYYQVAPGSTVLPGTKIHHSRILRFEGQPVPFYRRIAEQGWGISIIERMFDRLTSFDSTTAGIAQLAYRAYLRTMKINGFRDVVLAAG